MSFPPMCFPAREMTGWQRRRPGSAPAFGPASGQALLCDTAGVRALARVLDGLWPRTPGTAAVLVGHGSEHPGSMAYPRPPGRAGP